MGKAIYVCFNSCLPPVTFSLSTYYINRKEINIFVFLDDYLYLCSRNQTTRLTYGTEIQQSQY